MLPATLDDNRVIEGATMTDTVPITVPMAETVQRAQAGLVFLGRTSLDTAAIAATIAATLDRMGEPADARRCTSDTEALVSAQHLACRVRIVPGYPLPRLDATPARILALHLEKRAEGGASADTLVAHLLAALHATLSADFVQWRDPRAVLTRAEFGAAVADTAAMPAPVRMAHAAGPGRNRRLDVETARARQRGRRSGARNDAEAAQRDALRAVFRGPGPAAASAAAQPGDIREPTAPLRLSVWMLTLAIGLFALPVAAALTVIHLLRGENMRLAAQTAALTGTFMVLATHGQIAQAAHLIAAFDG